MSIISDLLNLMQRQEILNCSTSWIELCKLIIKHKFGRILEVIWQSMEFSGQNTGEGSHSLLQGIFLTQEWNPGLLHCRWILYCLSHQGSLLLLFLLCWVLVATCRIFTCSIQGLVPWPEMEPRSPALGARILTTEPQGASSPGGAAPLQRSASHPQGPSSELRHQHKLARDRLIGFWNHL